MANLETNYGTYVNHANITNNSSPAKDFINSIGSSNLTEYFNFNTAESANAYDLIPNNILVKVSLNIKKGSYRDQSKGWDDGYPTQSKFTGAIYLACEFTVLEGEYAGRKIWSNIGLYSDKNNNKWGDMGRSFIKSILNSAKGYSDKDQSDEAKAARNIKSFAELDGLEFVAKISQVKDQNDNKQNIIKCAIDPEHIDYAKLMNGGNGKAGIHNIAKPDWA